VPQQCNIKLLKPEHSPARKILLALVLTTVLSSTGIIPFNAYPLPYKKKTFDKLKGAYLGNTSNQ